MQGAEITRVIGSHGNWKERLLSAIQNGRSDLTVADARRDDGCEQGTWLLALPASKRKTAQWRRVQKLHSLFHVEAAAVLDLAVNGKTDEAKMAMADDSPFATCSANLISALMFWLDES